jgi:hypothetical protein
MNDTYIQLQKKAQHTIEELERSQRIVADLLDRISARYNGEHGFPSDHIWFEESIIIQPGADTREIQTEQQKPRKRSPRSVMAMKRDSYDGSQKVTVGFRVTTVDHAYVETSVPLTVRVEGSILHISLPDKTELKIETSDFPEEVKKQESALLGGVLREVHNMLDKFLTGTTKERIGFHQKSGEPV